MAGLVPAIHVLVETPLLKTWMPGTSPGMTNSVEPIAAMLPLRYVSFNDYNGTAMTEFDPATHRMVPEQRWFEDFVIGERFVLPGRTQTPAIFAAFQAASGDTHPIHYDVEYCRARGMPHLLAHGFQTLVHTAPGAGLFPFLTEESLVGFLEQSSKFLKPVYADDTIYPALEVIELVPGRSTGVVTLRSTVYNQRRELVLEGTQKFLIRKRPT
jgi:acyl dehydratase